MRTLNKPSILFLSLLLMAGASAQTVKLTDPLFRYITGSDVYLLAKDFSRDGDELEISSDLYEKPLIVPVIKLKATAGRRSGKVWVGNINHPGLHQLSVVITNSAGKPVLLDTSFFYIPPAR